MKKIFSILILFVALSASADVTILGKLRVYDRTNAAPPASPLTTYIAWDTNAPGVYFYGLSGVWTPLSTSGGGGGSFTNLPASSAAYQPSNSFILSNNQRLAMALTNPAAFDAAGAAAAAQAAAVATSDSYTNRWTLVTAFNAATTAISNLFASYPLTSTLSNGAYSDTNLYATKLALIATNTTASAFNAATYATKTALIATNTALKSYSDATYAFMNGNVGFDSAFINTLTVSGTSYLFGDLTSEGSLIIASNISAATFTGGTFTGNGSGITNQFFTPTNTLGSFTVFPVGTSWVLGATNHFLWTGFSGLQAGNKNVGAITTVGIRYVTNPPSWNASDNLTARWTTNGVFSFEAIPDFYTNLIIYNR